MQPLAHRTPSTAPHPGADQGQGTGEPVGQVSANLVAVPRGSELPPDLKSAWRDSLWRDSLWRDSLSRDSLSWGGGIASPFLDPAFVEAVASQRSDVHVLVGELDARPVVFLPLHRVRPSRAVAVGQRLSDLQGPVLAPGVDLDLAPLLEQAGIESWQFRRVGPGQGVGREHRWRTLRSHVVDLGADFDAYVAGRRAAGVRRIDQGLRKSRKLGREVGPLRFEFDSDSEEVLDGLLRWKSAQRARTGSYDAFGVPWARAAVQHLHARRGAPSGGRLSALWAGDELVAAHFGLIGPGVLHWWIPAYDPRFAQFSPGLVLVLALLRAAAEHGIQTFDLGYGDEGYKDSLATGSYALDAGAIERSRARRRLGRAATALRESVRRSPLEGGWHSAKRMARRLRGINR